MSRKGNSPYNGMMKSFFCILKSEMFYGYEKTFHSLEQLKQAIVDYIDYYNNKRIKAKLKGLSPVQYRTKSFAYINCLTFWGQYSKVVVLRIQFKNREFPQFDYEIQSIWGEQIIEPLFKLFNGEKNPSHY